MYYSTNPLIKHKTGLLNLAQELGNISQVCKVIGLSLDAFYRYQQAVEQSGVESLLNQLVAEQGIIISETQVQALERKKEDDMACGEIETLLQADLDEWLMIDG